MIDLESRQQKLSSDHSLNMCFSRCFPILMAHHFLGTSHCKMSIFEMWVSKWCKIQHFKIYSYSTFIHSYSTFVSIQHYYLFKIQHLYLYSTVLFVHKIIIHSTTFYSFKIYCTSLLRMELTYFLQRMNRGQRRSASDH